MFRLKHFWVGVIALLWLVVMAGACSDASSNSTGSRVIKSTANAKIVTLEQFLKALNKADLNATLSFFAEDGIVEVYNPSYSEYSEIGNVRRLSYDESVSYKGREWIKAYLFSLISDKFQSESGDFEELGDKVKWAGLISFDDANLQMSLEATFIEGKIVQLVLTYN